mmetsp:Transcript_14385/g.36238  ORF Transcript_14385/g.36238 Transcript_14385/m.36238 type:complete len:380 (+) Transcript_14385:480-1619(+)
MCDRSDLQVVREVEHRADPGYLVFVHAHWDDRGQVRRHCGAGRRLAVRLHVDGCRIDDCRRHHLAMPCLRPLRRRTPAPGRGPSPRGGPAASHGVDAVAHRDVAAQRAGDGFCSGCRERQRGARAPCQDLARARHGDLLRRVLLRQAGILRLRVLAAFLLGPRLALRQDQGRLLLNVLRLGWLHRRHRWRYTHRSAEASGCGAAGIPVARRTHAVPLHGARLAWGLDRHPQRDHPLPSRLHGDHALQLDHLRDVHGSGPASPFERQQQGCCHGDRPAGRNRVSRRGRARPGDRLDQRPLRLERHLPDAHVLRPLLSLVSHRALGEGAAGPRRSTHGVRCAGNVADGAARFSAMRKARSDQFDGGQWEGVGAVVCAEPSE